MPRPRSKGRGFWKQAPPREKAEHAFIKKLYETCGCIVISFAQAQRAQQTAGIPDMLVFDPKSGTYWWHEIKRLQGPEYLKTSHGQSDTQKWFESVVESFGQEYLLGARDVAIAKMQKLGRIVP